MTKDRATADGEGMAKIGLIEFGREVKREMAKVTWPTRREAVATTIAVLIMVVLTSIFFTLADTIISLAVKFVLGLGG